MDGLDFDSEDIQHVDFQISSVLVHVDGWFFVEENEFDIIHVLLYYAPVHGPTLLRK